MNGFNPNGAPNAGATASFENSTGVVEAVYLDVDVHTFPGDTTKRIAAAEAAALAYGNAAGYVVTSADISWQDAALLKKSVYKATVAGGAGVATFYTDSNGDGTGTALHPNLTADLCTGVVDGVSDQYAPQTPVVASDKKSVTVNFKKLTASGVTVVGITVVGSLTYANAANGLVAKLVVDLSS